MAVKCGWASCSEHDSAYGAAGDQKNGKEVKTGNWYYFNQNVVLRWKNDKLAHKFAQIVQKICDNNKVGYSQDTRTGLYTQLSKCGWNPDKITKKCNTDCSAMIAAAVNAVGVKVNKNMYTGNEVQCLLETGKFVRYKNKHYRKSSNYLCEGDIIVNTHEHTIAVLEYGKYGKAERIYYPTIAIEKGDNSPQVRKLQKILNIMINKKHISGTKCDVDYDYGKQTKKLCKLAQKYLKSQGHYNDSIDGACGSNTEKGLKWYYIKYIK